MVNRAVKKIQVFFIFLMTVLALVLTISPIIQADSPIEIYTIDDLWNIRNDLSGHYILMNDLDFENNDHYVDWVVSKNENTTGYGWLPIGNYNDPFTGTFDGQNYTISTLFVDRDDDGGIGLFGYTLDSTIININLIEIDVTGYDSVGGLIGSNTGSISKCSATGGVTGVYYVGGLVGDNWESYIVKSHAEVQVKGETCVGGLIGSNAESLIEQSYAIEDVSGLTDYDNTMGGLIGYNDGNITNCYATGDVVSEGEFSWYIGGLVGENDEGSYINNCYSTGYVTGNDVVGGLVGGNTGMVENCFWDKQTSGQNSSDGGTGKTTSELKNFNTFNSSGWHIAKIENYVDETWFIDHTVDYPHLGWEPTYQPNHPPNTPSNPNPSNHLTSVDINAALSWTGGDPDPDDTVTYDIYFGTINPPPKIISNHAETNYNPGTMNYNTKYYWKITAWDNHGQSTTGPVWDFTTKVNNPPNTPSNPNPSNHLTSVDINATLSWTGGDPDPDDTVTYDIYFGTTNPPPKIISNHAETNYNPGTMNYNTKYYWKITAWDNHGQSTTGPIWDFTTGDEPNEPPNTPSNPNPANHSTEIDLNADLNWTGGDPDPGDTLTYDIYFGTTSDPPLHKYNHETTSYDPGTMSSYSKYYWKIVSKDNHGKSTTGPIWDFTTIYVKQPPNTPYNPTPQNGSTSININQDLFWSGGDPNSDDNVTYDIYFNTSIPPTFKGTIGPYPASQTSISYNLGTMNYNTKYCWQIIAWDNHGNSSTGPIWSFTTGTQSSGGGGGGPFIPPNKVPIADASASENSGFINSVITFNGSYSFDEDGEITNYTWDFGDSSYGYGIITTHIYEIAAVYNVILTVTDDKDVSDTDSFKVIISIPNNPPTIPKIVGPKTGKQNIEYNFTVFSTDADDDTIQYVFYWGDEKSDETDFLANGTEYIQQHKWTSPGIYKIRVVAIDSNYKSSSSAETYILIDVRYCQDIGYFIDENSDGIYDTFYIYETKLITDVVYEDGNYLIDIDGDGIDNFVYNLNSDVLTKIETEKKDETPTDQVNLLILFIIVIIFIITVILLIIKRPKPKVEDKKDKTKEEKPNQKKQTKTSKKKSTTKKKAKNRK